MYKIRGYQNSETNIFTQSISRIVLILRKQPAIMIFVFLPENQPRNVLGVLWRVSSTSKGCSTLLSGTISTVGDTISTAGDSISTVGDNISTVRGYHKCCG